MNPAAPALLEDGSELRRLALKFPVYAVRDEFALRLIRR
jgi:hypothetical protein